MGFDNMSDENETIARMYQEAFEKERNITDALNRCVGNMMSAESKYDARAMSAEFEARRILDDIDNGLSPSEEAKWSDRIRYAERHVGSLPTKT